VGGQKLLGAPSICGGVPRQGLVVEGVNGVKYAPKPPGMYGNSEQMGSFPHLLT
jgi:hypothetical protein